MDQKLGSWRFPGKQQATVPGNKTHMFVNGRLVLLLLLLCKHLEIMSSTVASGRVCDGICERTDRRLVNPTYDKMCGDVVSTTDCALVCLSNGSPTE